MQSPFLFFASLFSMLLCIYIGYLPWFQPAKYIEMKNDLRKTKTYKYWFLPQALNNKIIGRFPLIDLVGARLTTLLCVIFCLIGMVAAIWSPYVSQ